MTNVRSRKPNRPYMVQRTKRRTKQPDNAENASTPDAPQTYPPSLLGNPLLNARGNEPVRVALMQQMQQTHSNRAMQRALQNVTGNAAGQATRTVQLKPASPPALPVQRDNKQETIRKVTAAAALTSAEEATWSDVSKAHKENIARWEIVSKRLKELKVKKTLNADETKEQDDLTKEEKDLATKIIAAKPVIARGQMYDDFKKAGTTATNWFRDFDPSATFLGMTIRASSGGKSAGAHKELADRLKVAEAKLEQDVGCKGAECAEKLGLYDISGLRQPQAATGASKPSMHCYGLAVDINYAGNPFIGNQGDTAVGVIKRATLLVNGTEFTVTAPPTETKPRDKKKEASEMFDLHQKASDALKEYLTLPDDPAKLAEKVAALQKKGDKRDVEAWKKQIKKDYESIWKKGSGRRKDSGVGDFENHKDPAQFGYMEFDKRMVEALVGAGLSWGGQYGGDKDMMHFDWRGGTIQRTLQKGRASRTHISRQAGWSDATKKDAKTGQPGVTPPSGGWNAGEAKVGGIRRIPIEGIKYHEETEVKSRGKTTTRKRDIPVGNWSGDADREATLDSNQKVKELTGESSVGKAIVMIPDTLNLKGNVDVLLHLHGFGVGFRQRAVGRPKVGNMAAGTVRDVEVDRAEQQLESSVKSNKQNMIAVFPQGGYHSNFGNFASDQYLDAVFQRLTALKLWSSTGQEAGQPARGRVVLSGHSGGGILISSMMDPSNKKQLPGNLAEVVLFDAMNMDYQLELVRKWVLAKLDSDLSNIKGKSEKDQLDYLRTSTRFRGYHSVMSGYTRRYKSLQEGEHDKKGKVLKRGIDDWFKDHEHDLGGKGSKVYDKLYDNYRGNIAVASGHEDILGASQQSLGGKAALEDALSALQ